MNGHAQIIAYVNHVATAITTNLSQTVVDARVDQLALTLQTWTAPGRAR